MWLRLPNALLDFLFSFRQKNVQLKLGVLAMLVFMVVQWWHAPSVYKNNLLNRLDAVIYDVRFQLLPPTRSAAVPIVIVDIDEASLQAEGRWPWSRSKVAQLVQQLQQQKVALVAFDVVFAEAESNPAQQLEQADHAQNLALYQQALDNYFTQQWETALMQFQQLQQHSPQEKIYTLYVERIYQQQHSATPTQWDGVFEHAHK